MDSIDLIRRQAKQHFTAVKGSHDWEHTRRVERLCRRIGPREGANPDILALAACLHDIGRSQQDRTRGTVCHARQGARMVA